MPWNSGVYTRGYPSWTNDANANLPISATKFDTEDNDFASGLNNCLTKDGLNTPGAAMTWGLASAQVLALTRGSDGNVFSVVRTGGANNPAAQLSVQDAANTVTLNASNILLLETANTLAATIAANQGIFLAGATGGSQGAGTLNATALYINGAPVGSFLGSGTAALSAASIAVGQTYLVWRSASASVTTTTSATDGVLQLTGLPPGRYVVNAQIYLHSGSSGVGYNLGVNVTSGALSASNAYMSAPQLANNAALRSNSTAFGSNAFANTMMSDSGLVAGFDTSITVEGACTVSSTATLAIIWGQQTSSANALVIEPNSFLQVTRLA